MNEIIILIFGILTLFWAFNVIRALRGLKKITLKKKSRTIIDLEEVKEKFNVYEVWINKLRQARGEEYIIENNKLIVFRKLTADDTVTFVTKFKPIRKEDKSNENNSSKSQR